MKRDFNIQYPIFNIQFPREGCVRTLATSDPLQVPINCRHHSPQRAKTIPNSPPYSASPCIQPMDPVSALDPFGHTEDISSGNPIPTLRGRIANDKISICSFLVNHEAVEYKSTVNSIQYNGTDLDIRRLQWPNPNCFAIADGWVHAGATGLKSHRRPLSQELCNDVLVSGHERTIPYLKGVGKT